MLYHFLKFADPDLCAQPAHPLTNAGTCHPHWVASLQTDSSPGSTAEPLEMLGGISGSHALCYEIASYQKEK